MRYEYFARNQAELYEKQGVALAENLPDIDLYMDQFVSCLNQELSLFSEDKEGPVTKAMVSNYVKHKMIPSPDGKKYEKDHVYFMLIAYYLKNLLSMEQISRIMAPVISNYSSEWDEGIDIKQLYNSYVKENEKDFSKQVSDIIANIKKSSSTNGNEDDMMEITGLILSLAMKANADLFLIQKLIEEYFPKK